MGHKRSPNCPQITFLEAAEKGRMLYAREHTHPASREAVAQGIGYSGLNGRSLSMIGALRQYGIIGGTGDALHITEDAVTYFELDSGPEREEALSRMLFSPTAFAQIHEDFGADPPSDQNLKYHLIKQGFLPKAADGVISVYRENIRLLTNTPLRQGDTVIPPSEHSDLPRATSAALATNSIQKVDVKQGIDAQAVEGSYTFPLGKGTFADVRIRGEITPRSLGLLRSQIELLIEALSDQDEES